jgi:hypothetical protein
MNHNFFVTAIMFLQLDSEDLENSHTVNQNFCFVISILLFNF